MSDNIKPTLAIMAAGLGQRYEGLKQLVHVHGDPINGHILSEYSIYDAIREGFRKIVPLIRKDFENDFRRYRDRIVEGAKKFNSTVEYAYQPSLEEVKQEYPFRKKMWGTGYAALCFEDKIKEPFALINADNFYGRESFKSLYEFFSNRSYDQNGNVHALVGYLLKNVVHSQRPVAEAICRISSDGFLESIVERTEIMRRGNTFVYRENKRESPLDPNSIVSTTFWGFNQTIFPHLKEGFESFRKNVVESDDATSEFYLPDFVAKLINEKKINVRVLQTEEKCFGMTYEKHKSLIQATIQKLIDRGVYPDKLWDGKN